VCEAWPFRRFFEVGYCFWSRCCCVALLWFGGQRWQRSLLMMGQMMMAKTRRRRETFWCVVKFCCVSRNQRKKSGTFSLSSGCSTLFGCLVVWRCLFGANVNVRGLSAGLFGYLATLPFWLRPVSLSAPFAL